ncbi:MAG: hypothetical protein RDV48_08245 [Candidatus Eremiobacteraeota bacterium]|nr:hypothetical protein [Candidatus Eremiobacteraeota bacterium]
MNIKKIFFFTYTHAAQNRLERYGTDIFKRYGYDVEIWDFMPIIYPHYHSDQKENNLLRYEYYKIFNNVEGFITNLRGMEKESFIVSFLPYNQKTHPIYREISLRDLAYSVFVANALPAGSVSNNWRCRVLGLMKKFKKLNWNNLKSFVFHRIPFSQLGVSPAAVSLMGGERSGDILKMFPVGQSTKKVWAHQMDYDDVLRESATKVQEKDIAVFIDDDMPFHKEYKLFKVKPFVTADRYYSSINNFFNTIEKEFKIRVVIAGCPRSSYTDRINCFGGRDIHLKKTPELVRSARFCIVHASTAINYVVAYRKPFLLISSDELDKSLIAGVINNFSRLFSKKKINIESPSIGNLKDELVVNNSLYDEYMNSYIKKRGSKEKLLWEIFIEELKAL